MRASIVPPYPSSTDVVSRLGGQAGDSGVPVEPASRPIQCHGTWIRYVFNSGDLIMYRGPRAAAGASPHVVVCAQGGSLPCDVDKCRSSPSVVVVSVRPRRTALDPLPAAVKTPTSPPWFATPCW